jgi:hypothetical protein
MLKQAIASVCFGTVLAALIAAQANNPAAALERLRADIAFLAADELEGRGTPSRGLDIAALYLESRLRAMGVAPGVNGSYRQVYTVGSYAPKDARVTVSIGGKPVPAADYVLINFGRDPAKGPIDAELVQAGNGIVLEEKGINELGAVDVKGKGVVVRKGAPWPLDPNGAFGPDRAMGKLMAATVRGAELVVYLTDDLDAGPDAESKFFGQMKNAEVAFIRKPSVSHVSALNPVLLLRRAALEFKPGSRIRITIEMRVREGQAANVLGKIPGTDPDLKDEWVVLSAHYDHIGSHAAPPGQDGIWNGADDNASGTAAVLEIARQMVEKPGKRGILVFLTSGEDRGIFGSAVYAHQPVVPMKHAAVQINLDMVGRSRGEVQAVAHISPELFQHAVTMGKAHGLDVVPDQQPSWRILYLTDNYHFARSGVPGVHFFTGLHTDYHQPSDTADKIRYEELSRIVALAADLTRGYAGEKARPKFHRPEWFVTP